MLVDINHPEFPSYNLPWGIFSTPGTHPRVGIAIGEHILDMAEVADANPFGEYVDVGVFYEPTLNPLIALGSDHCIYVRAQIQTWLENDAGPIAEARFYVPQSEATMHLPLEVGDYTDFYSSREHATNVGKLFRDPDKALLPNWRHLPVAYHGRSSTIVVSGTPVRRPRGQVKTNAMDTPEFMPSRRLDYELEMATVMHPANEIGQAVGVNEAERHIFGFALFNDWSARDIQKWEYQPLGPFLGKNFASTLAPWIVPLAALEPFRVPAPPQDPAVLPYLRQNHRTTFDVHLKAELLTSKTTTEICRTNFRHLYWTPAQQIAHHAVNGCLIRGGDVLASGTISGPESNGAGSLLELTEGGRKTITLSDGQTRTFLEDGDGVRLSGYCEKDGLRLGFGAATAQILPAHDL